MLRKWKKFSVRFPAPVEIYGKQKTPSECARRLRELIENREAKRRRSRRFRGREHEASCVAPDHDGENRYRHLGLCDTEAYVEACEHGIIKLKEEVPRPGG